MKCFFLTMFYLLFLVRSVNSQTTDNVIIVVNEEILVDAECTLSFNGHTQSASYLPGDFKISSGLFPDLGRNSTLFLSVKFSKLRKNRWKDYCYEFDLPVATLGQHYLIIYIYDLNIKKYRDMFVYNSQEKFLVEHDYGYSGIFIVRKSKKK